MTEPRDLTTAYALLVDEISTCPKCPLSKTRNKAVPGEGPLDAELMFVGEAPGFHENQQGRPFIGPAGQFLEELLRSIGLTRTAVYITNVVKCRPPNNRDPLPIEISACADYLDRQIALIRPRVVITLGRYSMAKFFPGESIGKIHGTARSVAHPVVGDLTAFAMYHPAAALHQPSLKAVVQQDMLKLPAIVEASRQAAAAARPPLPVTAAVSATPPTQLSLFE